MTDRDAQQIETALPLTGFLRQHYRRALLAVIVLLTFLAWMNRFIQDDAFISFRYALNLAQGHGLVWNIGEPVEGYTNFLWVLFIAAGLKLGIDPVLASQAGGLLLFAGTLGVSALLIREVVDSAEAALLGLLFLGTNYTFSIYATGGLETQLQVFLCTGIAYLASAAARRGTWTRNELLTLSLAMAAALLTRLDTGIICATAGLWCLASWYGTAPKEFARRSLFLAGPLLAIVGSWFIWKLSYYGDILPNTFRLKGSFTGFGRGAWYVHRFAMSYFLYPVLLFALWSSVRFVRTAGRTLWMLLAMNAAWVAYVLAVGGDFMEYRFMVPAIALGAPLGAWLLAGAHKGLRIAFLLLFAYGSLHHATTFVWDSSLEVEPKAMLEAHLFAPKEQWVKIGTTLGDAFGHDPDIRIAVTAAGSIAYYSQLTTIDMLGLSDRFVAAHGIVLGTRPGHERIAPLSYLRQRGVELAISHPTLVPASSPTFVAPFLPRPEGEPLPDAPLLEIPIDTEYKLIVWYLLPNPKIDEVIARHHWKISRVEPDDPSGRTPP